MALERIPHERYFVKTPTVDLYADPEAQRPITDYRAVLLESVLPDRRIEQRVYPTTRDY